MKKILFIFILFAGSVHAQEKVTLVRLWQLADSANFDLQKMNLMIQSSKLNEASMLSRFGPKIGVATRYQYQSEAFRLTQPALGLSFTIMQNNNYFNMAWLDWTLFEGFKRFYDLDQAEFNTSAAMASEKFVTETIRHQLTRLTLTVQLLEYEYRISEGSKNRSMLNLNRARNLVKEGQIAPADTLEFWQSILEIDKHQQKIDKQRLNLFNEIGFLLGHDKPVEPVSTLLNLPENDYGSISRRFDQQALTLTGQSIQKKYASAGSSYWPMIKTGMTWQYDKPGYDPISDEWVSYGKFDIGLNWLLWDWNIRKIAREQVMILHNDNQIQQRKLQIEREKEHLNLKNELRELEQIYVISKKQLTYKETYYKHRQEQYELAQIDANQLSITENDLTILELQELIVQMQILMNKINQIYVCGNFYNWSNSLEAQQ